MIHTLGDSKPVVENGCFVAENASVIGRVRIGSDSSVWFGSVVRGDVEQITIGERTNVQDLAVLHVDTSYDLTVGDDVTIGHRAVVHGCTVRDRVLVGMGAIIMNGAVIGEDCIVGAGAIVTEGTEIPPRSLVLGVPAKLKRQLTDDEIASILKNAEHYAQKAREYIDAGLSKGR